jgi:serine protease Do
VAGKSVTNAGEVRQAITAARNDNKNSVLNRVNSGGSWLCLWPRDNYL